MALRALGLVSTYSRARLGSRTSVFTGHSVSFASTSVVPQPLQQGFPFRVRKPLWAVQKVRQGSRWVSHDGQTARRNSRGFRDHESRTSSCRSLSSSSSGRESPSEPAQEANTEKLLTLPTILTLSRVVAVPALVAAFYLPGAQGPLVSTAIFTLASITDWLDGYLARKMKSSSAFGAFLDPVADKLMVGAALVLVSAKGVDGLPLVVAEAAPWIITLPTIAIIGREIAMSALREWAATQGGALRQAVAVNSLGKWKTATQMVAVTLLLLTPDSSVTWLGTWQPTLLTVGVVSLYASAALALTSLSVYMRAIFQAMSR